MDEGVDTDYSIQVRKFLSEADVGVELMTMISAGDLVGVGDSGDMVTYELVASNEGPDAATGALVMLDFSEALDCAWTSSGSNGATGHAGAGSGGIAESLLLPR